MSQPAHTIPSLANSAAIAPACTTIRGCRSCGLSGLVEVLALGELPLANALLDSAQPDAARPEKRFPLTLAFCPGCSLVQILETVDPEVLFGHYLYFSSFSESMLAHARRAVDGFVESRGLGPGSLVVELASNDGYLLKNFVARGIDVLGIEPARNIAEAARRSGIPTRSEFFGLAVAQRLRAEGVLADMVLGNNVLAHVADLNGFVAGAAHILKPTGAVAFEVPYLGEMIEHLEFDTIYHEHLCYFSLTALRGLFARHALAIVDAEPLPVHGGSVRVTAEHVAHARPLSARAQAMLDEERRRGMTDEAYYRQFAPRVRALCDALRAELDARLARGQKLAAYGASAKGSTLMNFAGIDARHLAFVADLSTVKQGRFTPGNRLPIVAPSALTDPSTRPDSVLLLSWNWADEIARQQRAYLQSGGTFIVPVPSVRVITGDDDARQPETPRANDQQRSHA
jgi:SAM-dependent methyltransferase